MMRDFDNVDQTARILVRYNNLPQSMVSDLVEILPKICAWDFGQLRDGKAELK